MAVVQVAFDAGNYLGETPAWSAREQALWWVNCEDKPELHRWEPATGAHTCWPMPQRIGGFAFRRGGTLLIALYDGLYDFTPASGELVLRVASPFPPHVALHESAVDRQGRLWIGGFDRNFPANRAAADAAICRLDGDTLVPVITGISVANALAFSPDGRTMYAADSPRRTVQAWELDPASGALSNPCDFITLREGEGFVDGATVDAEGGYWLANVAAGALRRYLPNGTLDRIVALPFSNPTKLAFGGPDLATIYVTSTRSVSTCYCAPTLPNGPIHSLRPGFSGLAESLLVG